MATQQRCFSTAESADFDSAGPASADGWILVAAAIPLLLVAALFTSWKFTVFDGASVTTSSNQFHPTCEIPQTQVAAARPQVSPQTLQAPPSDESAPFDEAELPPAEVNPPAVPVIVVKAATSAPVQPQLLAPIEPPPQPAVAKAPDLWALMANLPPEPPKPAPPTKPVIAIPRGPNLAPEFELAFQRLNQASPGPERLESIQKTFPLIENAAHAGYEEEAYHLAAAVVTQARKGSRADILRLARDTAARMQTLLEFRQAADTAVTLLNDQVDNAVANVTLGKYLCLVRGDWDTGLPFLVKGSNLSLKTAAEQDLQNFNEPEKLVRVGDNWWNIIPQVDEAQRVQLYQRAHLYYTVALANSLGPQHRIAPTEKAKAEQRRDLAARVMASPAGANLPETPNVVEGPPTVLSFRPALGLPGQEIVMQGRGFAAAKQVFFWSGVKNEPAEFRIVSDTQLEVIAPTMNRLDWPNGEAIITVITPWGAAVVSPYMTFQYGPNNETLVAQAAYGVSRGRYCSVVKHGVAVFAQTGSYVEGGGSGNLYFLQDGAVLNMGRDANAIVYYEPKATINNRDEKATYIPVPSIEPRYIGGSFRYLSVR